MGASRSEDEDFALLAAIETALAKRSVTIDRFFFDWRGGQLRADTSDYRDEFGECRHLVESYEPAATLGHPYWSDPEPCSMHIEEVEAIWSAIDRDDDWRPLEAKVAPIRRMGEALGQS